jgi:spermidine synthase
VGIGLFAFATPALFDLTESIYVGLHDPFAGSGALLTALRFVLSFMILLVPSTLMGATLPLAVRAATRTADDLGTHAGLIYATNTAGAVIGTLVVGSWLIGSMGIAFSFRLGGALNLVVGLGAILGSARWENRERRRAVVPPTTADNHPVDDQPLHPARHRSLVLGVFALSGFVSLGLEIVWFRVLVLYMDATSQAFAIMLATVLVGIAVGSYLVTPLLRRRLDWLKTLALLEGALAVLCLLSLFLLSKVIGVLDSPTSSWRFMLGASVTAILPPALLMGVAFPIGLRIWTAGSDDDARDAGSNVGVFYALNTTGGILGALVAGFVLVPLVGARGSTIILSALVLLSAIAVAAVAWSRYAAPIALCGVALFALLAGTAVPHPYDATLEHRYPGDELLAHEEGVQATVTVHRTPAGHREMHIDGLDQASTDPTILGLHRAIGALPTALHPDAARVLVVGLGGGATPGAAAAQHGSRVRVVELASPVVRAAKWFDEVNYGVTRRPNVEIEVDDGRNFLLLTDDRYDVITADVIVPDTAGAGKLWSVEYWELARDTLAPGGLMAQWVGDTRDDEYRMIIRSFMSVFPESTLWHDGALIIGTKKPLQVGQAAFERKLSHPRTARALADIGITDFDALTRSYVTGPEELRAFVGEGDVLTDDKPRLEFFRPKGDEALVDVAQIPRGGATEVFGP